MWIAIVQIRVWFASSLCNVNRTLCHTEFQKELRYLVVVFGLHDVHVDDKDHYTLYYTRVRQREKDPGNY